MLGLKIDSTFCACLRSLGQHHHQPSPRPGSSFGGASIDRLRGTSTAIVACKTGRKTYCRCDWPKLHAHPTCLGIVVLGFRALDKTRPYSLSRSLPVCIGHVSSGGAAYCVEYRGDWKWQRECFGFRTHWGAADFCHVCTALGKHWQSLGQDPLLESFLVLLVYKICDPFAIL